MFLFNTEKSTHINQTDSGLDPSITSHLLGLLELRAYDKAQEYLELVVAPLRYDGKYDAKFRLEVFFLTHLSKSIVVSDKVADLLRGYLEELYTDNQKNFDQEGYLANFSIFLLGQTFELGKNLAKHSYTNTVKIYTLVSDFFVKLKRYEYANLLAIKKGDLFLDNSDMDNSLEAYKEVFYNLWVSAFNSNEEFEATEIQQLTDTLSKISESQKVKNTGIYQRLNNFIKKPHVHELEAIIQETKACKDYNLYLNLIYIFSFLQVASTSLYPKPTLLDFIKYLQEETSIFKAVDQSIDEETKESGIEKIKALLSSKIRLDIAGPGGASPLQYAVIKRSKVACQILLRAGVSTEETYTITNTETLPPPIYLAISSEDNDSLFLLLQSKVKINASYGEYGTPLYYAISKSLESISQMLLNHGAKLTKNETILLNNTSHNGFNLYRKLFKHNINSRESLHDLLEPLTNAKTSLTKTPIFCPHAIDGNGFYSYKSFAQTFSALDKERPIFGIHSPVLNNNGAHPDTIPAAADLYIRAIKSKQPYGPYLFFGWSFAGLLVYEMARQLIANGEKVHIVGLCDTISPSLIKNMTKKEYAAYLIDIIKKLVPRAKNSKTLSQEVLETFEKEDQIKFALHTDSSMSDSQNKLVEIIKINLLAALYYQPDINPIDCPVVTCFNAEETCKKVGIKDLGWKDDLGNTHLIVRDIPKSDHFSFLVPNHTIIQEISKYITANKKVSDADAQKEACLKKARHYFQKIQSNDKDDLTELADEDNNNNLRTPKQESGNIRQVTDFFAKTSFSSLPTSQQMPESSPPYSA